MKNCIIYFRKGEVFIHPSSYTDQGLGIMTEPFFRLESYNPAELGEKVITALNTSKTDVPHPKDWGNFFKPFLNFVGVGSWGSFIRTTKCIQVSYADSQFQFIPTENLGSRGGFNDIEGSVARADADIDKVIPEIIGQEIMKCLELCK